jgi:adenylate kinase
MRIVLLGAPGSGKGTQAQRLMQSLRIPQVSTGDLLRAAVAKGSALGLAAKEAMDAGRLVADDVVLGMIRERLREPDAAGGFILDGFPRNLDQARALDALLGDLGQPLDAVVLMEVDYGELTRRISGRRTCRACGKVFNVYTSPPAAAETCPKTGTAHELFQRSDDKEETVAERLRVYEEKTRPLVDFYAARGLLRRIDAQGELDVVTQRLRGALTASSGAAVKAPAARASTRRAARRPPRKRAAGVRPRPKRPAVKTRTRKTARRKHARPAAGTRKRTARKTRARVRTRRRR